MTSPLQSAQAKPRPPRVVIVGAGFGGLAAAKALADAPVEVVVIDQRNHHTFQPLLYQVATAGLDVDDICYTTRGIFHRQKNARALQATVTGADFETKEVQTSSGPSIEYDYLILAIGAVTADFGVPGVADHTYGLKSAAEAMQIRNHVLRNFELAERTDDDTIRHASTTVVIVGGGPTGVEMAGGFAELIDKPLRRDFPGIDTDRARVVLVEGQDRLLASFAPSLGEKARHRLTKMGVEVKLSTQVAAVTADEVRFADDSVIASNTVIWAAGVRAHPLAEALGLQTARGGRVVVDEHLRVAGHDRVFAIGDLAASPDRRPQDSDEGGSEANAVVPQVAPGAMQGGQHVAAMIAAELDNDRQDPAEHEPFLYRDKGSMATIGRNAAVVELPVGPNITGFAGWVAWLGLHLVMLIGFRNRANVLVNWAWNYLTYDRGSRLIIELDDRLQVDDPSLHNGRSPS
ncbi:MAG: NAD(P)/FAD-dependent oxidoreductase [Acidimicrobiales bacterium]